MEFNLFKSVCKYCKTGIDENHISLDTCRNINNIPKGSSWGECSFEKCPFTENKNTGTMYINGKEVAKIENIKIILED